MRKLNLVLLAVAGATVLLIGYVSLHSVSPEVECYGNGVFLYSDGHTMQGISYRLENGASNGLVRGHLPKIFRHGSLIGGYLDTSHFEADGLLGFERDNDKEGYFIIDLPSRGVEAGLEMEEFQARFGQPLDSLEPSWTLASGHRPWTCLGE